ncbi:hypothetical protein [Corynebacterium amycolatum]|uniref:hypothetical protein n=1 Tax=Corynebacterium amycolatum TaxID=43765 RepID=UPI000C77503E|nr:hypothetical protein [Corynebacterium amycolatum]MDK7314519.1 hypothetical protein [Corynebacterium amycolatum]PKZ23581.1 hypothetical protein CYJ43_00040 [Corynebacterium amycolatum]
MVWFLPDSNFQSDGSVPFTDGVAQISWVNTSDRSEVILYLTVPDGSRELLRRLEVIKDTNNVNDADGNKYDATWTLFPLKDQVTKLSILSDGRTIDNEAKNSINTVNHWLGIPAAS